MEPNDDYMIADDAFMNDEDMVSFDVAELPIEVPYAEA